MQFCLLNMYLHIRPKRADFVDVRVYVKNDPHRKDRNYVVLAGDKSYFVLNHYNKTQKDNIPILENFGAELSKVFCKSLLAFPRKHLFVGGNGKPFQTSNAFSKFVTATFKTHLGKATGVSLLRHMFINEKVDLNKLSIEQLPQSLADALDIMERSELVASALGEHIFEWFLRNKRAEWRGYKTQVTPFELNRYLRSL